MLRQLSSDLWVAEHPVRFLGLPLATRMTVVRLRAGGLFVHSPVGLNSETRTELEALGAVEFVAAPNRFHHLYLAEFRAAFPNALCYCAPGLEKKRPDLSFDGILSDQPEPGWAGEIDQVFFRAFAALNEIVFCHRASRTVIFTDLCFNITAAGSWLARTLLTLDGGLGRFAVPRSFRLPLRWRRGESRTLINRVLDWDFDRVIVGHGDVVETAGKQIVRAAWSFL